MMESLVEWAQVLRREQAADYRKFLSRGARAARERRERERPTDFAASLWFCFCQLGPVHTPMAPIGAGGGRQEPRAWTQHMPVQEWDPPFGGFSPPFGGNPPDGTQ